MPQSQHAEAAELHTHAAYSHAAAECQHSTGDHLCARDLAKMADRHSKEAARMSEELAKRAPEQLSL
jgi:hypothetical protein